MTDPSSSGRTYKSELLSMMCTMQCMAELAQEQGDKQIAAILHNAAALLDLTMFPASGSRDDRPMARPGSAKISTPTAARHSLA